MPRSVADIPPSTSLRIAVLALIFGFFVLAGGRPADAAYLDYVYVDSNEGQASGGHVGLAFGGQIFHFQYREGGFLLPVRHATGAFERAYRVRENRNLRQHRIEVDQETYDLLRDGFNARYFESEVLLSDLEELRAEEARLDSTDMLSRGQPLAAAGYFFAARADPDSRAEIEARTRGEVPAKISSVDELSDYLSRRVESEGRPLQPDVSFPVQGEAGQLSPAQIATLRSLQDQFDRQLGSLKGSSRPDVGEVRFVVLARRSVVARSLSTGRLHMLDVYPDEAETIEVAEVQARGGRLEHLLAVTEKELARGTDALHAGQIPSESDWSRIEDAANRRREILRAMKQQTPLRIVGPRMLPAKSAWRTDLGGRDAAGQPQAAALAKNREKQKEILRQLQEQSSYNLITRNCVSEVFDSIDEILAGPSGKDPVAESMARLGGHVAGDQGFVFVPFVSAETVAGNLRVAETIDLPSYRSQQLADVYEKEGEGAAVYFRESNTLTSTIYRYNAEDSVFVFFTDDVVLARPLYGVVNLTAGLGAAVVGLPYAPFDRGRLLMAGARGVFWSVPELFFLSFRKGSFFTVPPPARVGAPEDS